MAQPACAACAAFWKSSEEAPGTLAVTTRWDSVTLQAPSARSRVTVAAVRTLSATRFALPSSAESAIVKQPAWEAARSSSGLVPFPLSNRAENEKGLFSRTPLSVEILPLPVFRSPCHSADAVRLVRASPVRRRPGSGVIAVLPSNA